MATVYVAVRFWHHRSRALRFDPPSCLASVVSGSAANDVFELDNPPTPAAVAFSEEQLSLLNNKISNDNFS